MSHHAASLFLTFLTLHTVLSLPRLAPLGPTYLFFGWPQSPALPLTRSPFTHSPLCPEFTVYLPPLSVYHSPLCRCPLTAHRTVYRLPLLLTRSPLTRSPFAHSPAHRSPTHRSPAHRSPTHPLTAHPLHRSPTRPGFELRVHYGIHNHVVCHPTVRFLGLDVALNRSVSSRRYGLNTEHSCMLHGDAMIYMGSEVR